MAKVWVNIVLTQEKLLLNKPKQVMSALFNVDRSISWEENFNICLIENVKRIGVIDLAGRDLNLTVSGVRLNASDESDMFGFISDLAGIILNFFKLDSITATFVLSHAAPSEVSLIKNRLLQFLHLMHITTLKLEDINNHLHALHPQRFIKGIYCYVQGDGKNSMTIISQTLNNVKEIYDQITEDNDVFFIIDEWKKSLQLYHDKLFETSFRVRPGYA
jgi:hypothetical protein